MPSAYGNKQKHESKNPLQRALIGHFHAQLAAAVRALAPKDILEVGCGEGYLLQALRDAGVSVPMLGIDLSEAAIAEARTRVPDARFEVKDALALADAGEQYDLVLICEVLEHLPQPERMLDVLGRIARRHVIASVPWEPFFRGLNFLRGKHLTALGNDPEHVNHWSRGEFLRFVSMRFELQAAPLAFPWTLVSASQVARARS
ncbi:MAG: class I SAM-dependent methyltransferase [Polyangiales bacterium]